jgi:hypothetical protein
VPKTRKIQTSFAGGYLSGRVGSRIDFNKYGNGCRVIENFMIHPVGGATKIPGLVYQSSAKFSNKASRLITFMFSEDDSYILEFGDFYIRFYRDWGQLQSGAVPYEIATPFASTDIINVQRGQNADVMYLTNPSFPTQKLSRLDHTDWTIEQTEFKRGPFLDENDTEIEITPDGTTGDITLTASDDVFEAGHVGSLWQITLSKDSEDVDEDFASSVNDSTAELDVALDQELDFDTHKTWTATVALERTYDGTNWETVYQFSSRGDSNKSLTFTEEIDDAQYRATVSNHTTGTIDINLTSRKTLVDGIVEITAVTNAQLAEATVINDLAKADIPTTKWSEGSWNDVRGYPRGISFFQQRMFLGSTTYEPTTIWGSVAFPGGDFENFLPGTEDDRALTYTIAESQDPIMWLQGEKSLLAGTVGGQYILASTGNNSVLTPSNPHAKIQDSSGTVPIQPVNTSLGILFVEKGSKRVNEFNYNWESDRFRASNMTRLAEDIVGTGIKEIAFQKRPERVLWCVTNDGDLIGLTYLREEDVIAWFKRTTDGNFESVATKPGKESTGNVGEDEIWVIVNRTVGGSEKRYIERISSFDFGAQENGFFVDSGVSYDGEPAVTFYDISHLEGKTVAVCGDGSSQNNQVVSGGSVTIDEPASVVHIGLPYTATLEPMRPQQGEMNLGSEKAIKEVAITVFETNYLKVGPNADDTMDIIFREADDLMDNPIPLKSKTVTQNIDGGWEKEGDFVMISDVPLPCNILSITMILETT